MVTNSFIYKKMESAVAVKRKNGKKVCIGFVRRDAEDEEEMCMHQELLCNDYVLVDPLRFTVNYTNDKIVLRILFDTDTQKRATQINTIAKIKVLLENDLDDNGSYFWSAFLIERVCKSLYAFDLLAINFLHNNKGVAIICAMGEQFLY